MSLEELELTYKLLDNPMTENAVSEELFMSRTQAARHLNLLVNRKMATVTYRQKKGAKHPTKVYVKNPNFRF